MATALQADDNLTPGQTYTFQLKCNATFCFSDLTNTIQNDLAQWGPNFLSALQVSSPSLTSLYNCQFTYSGDGSDVVADVGAQLVSAVQQGSNDSVIFIGAVGAPASAIAVTPGNAAAQIGAAINQGVQGAVNSATKTAAQGVQNILTPIEVLVVLLAALVGVLIFTAGKSGGIKTPTFSVGG